MNGWKICESHIFCLILQPEMSTITATIGFFDGVHRGHQYLIRQVTETARREGGQSLIVTMHPHPKAIVQPGHEPRLLTLPDEKMALLHATGADRVEMLHFSRQMSLLSAQEFMQKVLKEQFHVDTLVMGYEHQFGHGGGTLEQYRAWGRACGIEVVRAHEMEGEHVSSSVVRHRLEEGDISQANRMLGRRYSMEGTVVKGHQIGRTLGFPTANIEVPEEKLVPARGVYATWVVLPGGNRYKGMLNIGRRPTLDNGEEITIEVHIMDFQGDIYRQRLELQLEERLRAEQRFGSLAELRSQLASDAQQARRLLE